MNPLSIPHDALVFIGDGQKALFLRNAGDSSLPNLITERVLTDANLPTHEQGTDRPGRVFKRASTNLRSSVRWRNISSDDWDFANSQDRSGFAELFNAT
jgi:protein required for attachment to host cells